jgi:hypothetical protein
LWEHPAVTHPRPAAAHGSPDELLARAEDGDVSAFARLVRLRHETVTRSALVVTLDAAVASLAATEAFGQAWRAMRSGAWSPSRRPRDADELDRWLGAAAVHEGVRLLELRSAVNSYPDAGLPPISAPVDPGPLSGLDADDRALLALAVWVGLPARDLARASRRRPAEIEARLDRLVAEVLGEHPVGDDRLGGRRRLRARLVAWSAALPVPQVDPDRVARVALASEVHQREHRVSIAIGFVAGLAVATYPFWAPLLVRR